MRGQGMIVDPSELSEEQIAQLQERLSRELAERQQREFFGQKACELIREYRSVFGYAPPAVWQAPSSIWEAYLPGDVVEHAGRTWAAVGHCLLTVPGGPGWVEHVEAPDSEEA